MRTARSQVHLVRPEKQDQPVRPVHRVRLALPERQDQQVRPARLVRRRWNCWDRNGHVLVTPTDTNGGGY
jgi:hypothetical protein